MLWARVAILLNLRDVEAATAAAHEALAATLWPDAGIRVGNPTIHGHPDLPIGWCFLDPATQTAVVSAEVLDEFGLSGSLFGFVRAIRLLESPGFRRFDVEAWRAMEAVAV